MEQAEPHRHRGEVGGKLAGCWRQDEVRQVEGGGKTLMASLEEEEVGVTWQEGGRT